MVEVSPEFILPLEHRPKLQTIEAENIPLIDLSPLNSDTSMQNLVSEIGNACRNWGFFQVVNHGVPPKCREKIESASKKFFSLPKEEKKKITRDEANPFGFYDTEHTKNVRDWKQVFDCSVRSPTFLPASHLPHDTHLKALHNKWPQTLPQLREAVEEYAAEMEKLGFKVLELVAMSLGLGNDRFSSYYKDHETIRIRLNYYPSCPNPDLALGIGRHKDGGVLTILAQDSVGGLQVKSQTDGEWVLVKPVPDAYIVNLGDILQVWSNEEYKSVEHRAVVNSEKERFSIPFFFNPAHDTWVEPLEELVSEENPPKYKGYKWGKFLAARNMGNFKKLNVENIQLSDFGI